MVGRIGQSVRAGLAYGLWAVSQLCLWHEQQWVRVELVASRSRVRNSQRHEGTAQEEKNKKTKTSLLLLHHDNKNNTPIYEAP